MKTLIERLRYKYADLLHLEAADRLEELEAENERLRAVFKRLEERLKYIDPVALDIAREALAAEGE